MIKIKPLNKIYKSKKRKKCRALQDVNLTFGNSGLVFVLGKSGSGKSTLLNLIGGLDNITSGSIEVDGNDLSKFKEDDFCNYRNTHIGFIFQDYHLIDNLTVYENIALSLNLRRHKVGDKIKKALAKVDLSGYEDRYPSELSGGERQRVAIARAIVKNPRIILADEPTGNLDTHTAKSIVTLLKSLSRDCLILIVSHNVNDANAYADRIIELSKGRIISDRTKNPDFSDKVTLSDGNLVYPKDTVLSDMDVDFINKSIQTKKARKIIKRNDKFIATPPMKNRKERIRIENKRLSLSRELSLSGKFLKNKTLAITLSAFMVAVIMVIMALAQTIIAFDAGEIISNEMSKSKQDSLLMSKTVDEEIQARLDDEYRVAIEEGDIQAFYDAGFEGEIYPILNVSLPIIEYSNYAGVSTSYFGNTMYIKETFGTMVVGEEFFENKFGGIHYLAQVEDLDPAGVIITDYVADSILALHPSYNNKSYNERLGKFGKFGWSNKVIYINGIIETDYKERHASILERIENQEFDSISDMYQDEEFIALSNEIYEKLGFSYTLNPNFVEQYKESWATVFLYRQKIMVNDVLEIQADSINRLYMSKGYFPDNLLRDGWRYTTAAPSVPKGAKYVRVAFGTTAKEFDVNENPLYSLFAMESATLVFSDGSFPGIEQLNFENDKWLGLDGVSIEKNGAWPKSKLSDYIEIPEGCYIKEFVTYVEGNHAYCAFYDENKNFISSYSPSDKETIAPGTIHMNYENYNQFFGTNYDKNNLDTFVPHKVKLTQYRFYDIECKDPLLSVEVLITELSPTTWVLNDDLAAIFANNQVYYNALYFDGTEGMGSVLDVAEELNYEHQSVAIEGIYTMTKAVDVFIPIFELVAIFLSVGVIFILVNFSTKMINDKMHDIGILKALGAKNGSVVVVFGLQVALIAVLTCILATAGYYFFIDLANDVLIESLKRLAPSRVVLDLNFLTFKPFIAAINCALVAILAMISMLIPLIKIKNIKPVQIIKTKE